jgi:hypothetical protein
MRLIWLQTSRTQTSRCGVCGVPEAKVAASPQVDLRVSYNASMVVGNFEGLLPTQLQAGVGGNQSFTVAASGWSGSQHMGPHSPREVPVCVT